MPATSKAQRRLMGMALAYKKGELKNASQEVMDLANDMSEEDLRKYAETPEANLPDKVKESFKAFLSNALNEDKFPGGIADGKSVEDIAAKHGVDVKDIEAQLAKGIKVEMEHTTDKDAAREIAIDHLFELPDYYDRLADMEKEAEATNEGKMKELDSLIKDTTTRGLDIMDFLGMKEKDWNHFVHGKVWKDKVKSKDPKVKQNLMDAIAKRMNEMATTANTPGMGSTSFPSTDGGVGSGDIPHDLGATGTTNTDESCEFMTFEAFVKTIKEESNS